MSTSPTVSIEPLPWLDVMFAPKKVEWANEWFRPVTNREYQDSLSQAFVSPHIAHCKGRATRKGNVCAADLCKRGKLVEALSLLSTIGE